MIDRVNGSIRTGVWVEQDVRFMSIVATNATFLADLVLDSDETIGTTANGTPGSAQRIAAVGSDLEQILERVSQRATILGVHVGGSGGADTTELDLMLGYASGFQFSDFVTADANGTTTEQLAAEIDTIGTLADTTIFVDTGFVPAYTDTPPT